ncbi:MAG: PepSY domain-containing protein, partial [Cyclobacteriaceae bacterium]
MYVQPDKDADVIQVSRLKESLEKVISPNKDLYSVTVFAEKDKSVLFETYKSAEEPGWTFFSQYEYWDKIYVDPYSGEILGEVNMIYDWIYLCRMMHQQLLLNYEIGHWPVAISTLIIFLCSSVGFICGGQKQGKT